jgi:RNA polymerase sigma factor (sigma-70 family)
MYRTNDRAQPRIIYSVALGVPESTQDIVPANLNERRRTLVKFVRARVEDAEVAEDLVQDVIYQFLRSADAGSAIEDVTSWLYRAARNRIVDWYRKRDRSRLESPDRDSEIAEVEAADVDHRGPQSRLESAELWEAFLEALDELPEDQRQVFILHELEGVPFSEIAEMTGIKLNTLLSRKRYAVLQLRKKLNPFR